MKKSVIAIMGIAIVVIGICVAHGVNDDYVADQINQMAGQILIGEDYAYRIEKAEYEADQGRWAIWYEKIDEIYDVDGMVLSHTAYYGCDLHYSTKELIKAYNNFASMDVLDI